MFDMGSRQLELARPLGLPCYSVPRHVRCEPLLMRTDGSLKRSELGKSPIEKSIRNGIQARFCE